MAKRSPKSEAPIRFESPCLIWLHKAFVRRWKPIKYHARQCSLERSLQGAPPIGESLIVDFDSLEDRPTRVRFRVWGDGMIWFRACQRGGRGWAFVFAARGRLNLLDPSEVVRLFELSLGLVYGSTRKRDAGEQLLKLWKEAQLELETWRVA